MGNPLTLGTKGCLHSACSGSASFEQTNSTCLQTVVSFCFLQRGVTTQIFFFFDTYLSCTWEIEIKRAGCTASIMCINIVMGQGVPEMLRSSSHPLLSPQRCSGTFTPRSTEPSPEVSPMLQSTFDFQAGDDSCPIGSRSDHTQ